MKARVKEVKRVLVVGGSDPSGGTGLQVDLFTLIELGVFPYSIITAVTAQNSLGVFSSLPLPSKLLSDQLKTVFEDTEVAAIKAGMLGTRGNAEVLTQFLKGREVPLVVDPVLEASDGTPLLEGAALDPLKTKLLPLTTVVTPNLIEAEKITGNSVRNFEEMKKVAQIIHGLGCEWVLIKGGHLAQEKCVDLLYDGKKYFEYEGERIASEVRGTGSILASALTAYLAKGLGVPEAVQRAKVYLEKKIKAAIKIGKGRPQILPAQIQNARLPSPEGKGNGGQANIKNQNF